MAVRIPIPTRFTGIRGLKIKHVTPEQNKMFQERLMEKYPNAVWGSGGRTVKHTKQCYIEYSYKYECFLYADNIESFNRSQHEEITWEEFEKRYPKKGPV